VAALREADATFEVEPAYPRIRLWPDAAASLFGSPDALPRITPGWEKRYLGLDGDSFFFQGTPLPLGAIYLLGARDQGHDAPVILPLSPRESLMSLVPDTYGAHLLDAPRRAKEFDDLARLVECVPVRRATAAREFSRIDELCGLVLEDLRRLRERRAS